MAKFVNPNDWPWYQDHLRLQAEAEMRRQQWWEAELLRQQKQYVIKVLSTPSEDLAKLRR